MGALAADPKQGGELFPLMIVPGILTAGVLIAVDSLPWVVRWVHWATPFSFATINITILEFYYNDAKINCLRPISPQLDYFLTAVHINFVKSTRRKQIEISNLTDRIKFNFFLQSSIKSYHYFVQNHICLNK